MLKEKNLHKIHTFGCEMTWIDWSDHQCRFYQEGACYFPFACNDTVEQDKYDQYQRIQPIPVHELKACPKLSDAKRHIRDLASSFRRVWDGDDLVPIQNGKLIEDGRHHYRRPDQDEIEMWYALQGQGNLGV